MHMISQRGWRLVYLRVISEAEEFAVINCCDYTYYNEVMEPPWDDDMEEE